MCVRVYVCACVFLDFNGKLGQGVLHGASLLSMLIQKFD